MNTAQWTDPRFLITLMLIILFGTAYMHDPTDQAMKGAIIAAFSAAYGFWLGSKGNEKAAENTSKAFDVIQTAQRSGAIPDDPDTIHSGDDVKIRKK